MGRRCDSSRRVATTSAEFLKQVPIAVIMSDDGAEIEGDRPIAQSHAEDLLRRLELPSPSGLGLASGHPAQSQALLHAEQAQCLQLGIVERIGD